MPDSTVCSGLNTCIFARSWLHIVCFFSLCFEGCLGHVWPANFPTPPGALGFKPQFVDVDPGVPLLVIERPGFNSSLPPIVFVHGLADAWRSWQLVLAELGSERRIIAYDLRGHGASSKPVGNYTFPMHVHDLNVILRTLGVRNIGLLVGHSLGSILAWHFSASYPDQVERLILAGTTNDFLKQFPEKPESECLELAEGYRTMGSINYTFAVQNTEVALNIFRPEHWFYETCNWDSMQMTGPSWGNAVAGSCLMPQSDAAVLIPKIKARTVIVRGSSDQLFTRADHEAVLQLLQPSCHGQFLEVPDEGHSIHWTDSGARALTGVILDVLKQSPGCSLDDVDIVFT
eukprot:TRINITY_DN30123_c0_g1_i1.p1 TRINITY_DN30123_c0_g1~~TRINITY_DN30123_c0_g1_i1.p1  ORF type:complete len:345 (-),score=35.69 TRINITY_DN30123_c0_g1_i1:33-1067(-)